MSQSSVSEILTEYLNSAFHYILYKRAIHPANEFIPVQRLGMGLMQLQDPQAKLYIDETCKAAQNYIAAGKLQQILLSIVDIRTNENKENWAFIITQPEMNENLVVQSCSSTEIQCVTNEAAQVLKQIGVSFLPEIGTGCSFKIVLILNGDAADISGRWKHLTSVRTKIWEPALDMRPLSLKGRRIHTSVSSNTAE